MSLGRILSLAIFSFSMISCASMKDLEKMSSSEVKHLWKYYRGGEEVKVEVKVKEEVLPSYRPPKFVRVKVGSYVDSSGGVHLRKDVYLKVRDEDYGTDF